MSTSKYQRLFTPRVTWLAALLATLGACSTQGQIGQAPADSPTIEPPEAPPPPFAPAATQLLRLTRTQIENSIHDVLGDDIGVVVGTEPDIRQGGFYAVGAGNDSVSSWGVDQYEDLAIAVAEQAMEPGEARDARMPCTPSGTTDAACATQFVERYGRLFYRRALRTEERDRLVALANDAATELGDFHRGLSLTLIAMLQSPNFLYRNELGEPTGEGENRLVGGTQLASRISYFLWDTTPDDELLRAAENGELDTPEGLASHVDRMLADDRTRRSVRQFFTELLELKKLDYLSKDRNAFLHYSPAVGPDARTETLLTIEDHIFEQDGDYRDLMTTRRTFLNRRLASIYEVPAPAREGFAAFEHPADSPRRGILGQLSVLALHSHATRSSPTLRGAFIRINLLCTEIPPPPADVVTELSETDPTLSIREQLWEHRENPVCASCHELMDPIGLGFENFDGLGQWRENEWLLTFDENGDVLRDENNDRVLVRGADIDPSGDLDGVAFDNVTQLTQAIHDHPDLGPCLTRSLYRFATGHIDAPSEEAQLRELSDGFASDGYRVRSLMRAIALSDGFRMASGLRDDEFGGAAQ